MIGELCILLTVLPAITLWATIVQVEQYEAGVGLRLGKFYAMLNPGWNFVVPLITQVFKVDLRIQPLEIPNQDCVTRDNSRTTIGAVMYYRVADAKKAVLNVADYRAATVKMAQTTLSGVVGDMQLDEIFSNLDEVNSNICDKLNSETHSLGVLIDTVEIRKHNPLVESERRAAILKAGLIESDTRSLYRLEPYESAVPLRIGMFNKIDYDNHRPGEWNFVVPFVSRVFKVDTRDQILEVPHQEIITKDNSKMRVKAIVNYSVVDSKVAVLAAVNYKEAIVDYAMSSLRSSVEGKDFYEISSGQNGKMSSVEVLLRDKLSIMTESIGIEINNVQVREAGSSHNVDASVEVQIIAEREKHESIFNIGWKRSLWNFVTQRSLRSFFGTSNHSSEIRKASSIAYKLFTLIFLIVSLSLLYALIWVSFNVEINGEKISLEKVPD